jgi:hypothetical protein
MPFLVFELIFAALVVGLLVVAVMIVRQIRHDRQAKARPAPREPKPAAAVPRRPGLRRKVAEPEPEPAAPVARKRQLRSLSEVERETAEEDGPPAPAAPEVRNFSQRVLARLEGAFERFSAGEISLDAYKALVLAEQEEVDQRIAVLRAAGGSPDLDEALAAKESVRWCLEWADEQRRGQPHGA